MATSQSNHRKQTIALNTTMDDFKSEPAINIKGGLLHFTGKLAINMQVKYQSSQVIHPRMHVYTFVLCIHVHVYIKSEVISVVFLSHNKRSIILRSASFATR